jgi:iron complex outermembrane receptor protein
VTFIATGTAPTADFRYGVRSSRRFTYRIAPTYQLSKDVMLYATYSTGYKPGGIAFVGNKYDPYNPDR